MIQPVCLQDGCGAERGQAEAEPAQQLPQTLPHLREPEERGEPGGPAPQLQCVRGEEGA